MNRKMVVVALAIFAGMLLCPPAGFAQNALGPNGSTIMDRLTMGYVSSATAKSAIAKLVEQRRKAVLEHPKDPSTHYDLGKALGLEAEFAFSQNHPEQATPLMQEAIAEQQKAIKLNPSYADAYFSLGADETDIGKNNESENDIRKGASLDPNNARGLYDLGLIANESSPASDTAINYFRKAADADPHMAIAWYNLGVVLQARWAKNGFLSDVQAAVDDYHKALSLWPFFQNADTNLIQAVHDLSQYDQEEKLEQQAIAQNPDEPAVYVNLGNLYKTENKPDQAIPLFRKATQIDPESVRAYENLAGLLADNTATQQEAEADYQAVIRINPNQSDGYGGLGYVYLRERKIDDAITQFRKAVAIDPKPALLNLLGGCYVLKGDYDDALPVMNLIIADEPSDPFAHVVLGEILYHQGKKDEARQEWQKVLTMGNQAAAAQAQKQLDADNAATGAAPTPTTTAPSSQNQGTPPKSP